MKIEGNNPNPDSAAAKRLERSTQEQATGVPADTGKQGGDRVQLSSDAALANDAVKAASSAPDVRRDVVERMKKALAAGEVGNDPDALAERLIDGMLDEQ
jgi:flagellar biosynthesis anti-sigma factor FlgM